MLKKNFKQNCKNFQQDLEKIEDWFSDLDLSTLLSIKSHINKTEHAVHSYAAGKGWIYCNAKNAEQCWEFWTMLRNAEKCWALSNVAQNSWDSCALSRIAHIAKIAELLLSIV